MTLFDLSKCTVLVKARDKPVVSNKELLFFNLNKVKVESLE